MGDAQKQGRRRYGPSSYRAQRALLLTTFAELEPLCRPQADLGQEEPHKQEHSSVPKPMHEDGREQVSRAEHRKPQHDAQC